MRIVIISNRLPFTVSTKGGQVRFKDSPGGLTTGLWSYLEKAKDAKGEQLEYLWIGWPGSTIGEEHREEVTRKALADYQAHPVFLSEEAMDHFYLGFCNETIWPLFHYFSTYATYDEKDWEQYQQVNHAFFRTVQEVLRPGDVVWVHDYQLMLLPGMIREHFPELPVGFFLHIPFPSYEIFRLLPRAWGARILEGLLGSSLIGFHTHDYTRHFLSCALRTLGHEHHLGEIQLRNRVAKVDTFPMGINFDKFSNEVIEQEKQGNVAAIREKFGPLKVIFSVDRLDYTKGIISRLEGYDLFLRRNPEWLGKVVLILAIAPSRTGVSTYMAMKREIDEWVGRIHGGHGNMSWSPILYQYRNIDFSHLVSMYRACDVALITPLRDGMNLVAKEFLASRTDQSGVLILSEMAGAAKEMGEAFLINPYHHEEIAGALEEALSLPLPEQKRRNGIMQSRLRRYTVIRWAEDFVHALTECDDRNVPQKTKVLETDARAGLAREFRSAKQKAILLDYDGTLVPFVGDPSKAGPDEELLVLLEDLCRLPSTKVSIVSGRPRADLERWLGHLPVGLIAEHGVWLRTQGGEWRKLRAVTSDWKEQIGPILQLYMDRLPGAMLEEKEFSLAWHYRRADPEQGSLKAKELLDDLVDYTKSIDVQVLEGNKVIEVRNSGVTKGAGVLEWLSTNPSDFILAFGDDWTDEDMFRALPAESFTVRVGTANTVARFQIGNATEVRAVLKSLSQV